MDKRKRDQRHARMRAMQRYGVQLGPESCARIVADIHRGRARFVKRSSRTRTVWNVTLPDGQIATVVYSSSTKTIVTVLPNREIDGGRVGRPDD